MLVDINANHIQDPDDFFDNLDEYVALFWRFIATQMLGMSDLHAAKKFCTILKVVEKELQN